ncbi:MAG: DUF924 domain-containing protein [Sphingosinicella sp.]|nr:DUF924 domain-containing protein [Sphingosinicella sp.]
MSDWASEVLNFWFAQDPARWWEADTDFDAEVKEQFLALWEEQQQRPIEDFLHSADEAAAAVVLFDQLPRNMFRGHAKSFATDHMALAIARAAIDRGYDDGMDKDRRAFLYMPFEHSEDGRDQIRSIALFTALGDSEYLRFATQHQAVIERFGRYPHRNQMLGRTPRPDEIAAGDVFPW